MKSSDRLGKMESEAFRGAIQHFHMKGWNATQVKLELDSVHGDSAPSYSAVRYWINEFKRGRTSIKDEPSSGRPKTATTEENVRKVHRIVMNDRRVKVREIADELKISPERVFSILRDSLGMKKLNAKWLPHRLSVDEKLNRVLLSEQNLAKLNSNPTDFFRRFVTVDETWVHYYTPESKQACHQWTGRGEAPPTRVKTSKSAGKVMATVFWDQHGIILIDYL